jgi:hypothetical protein
LATRSRTFRAEVPVLEPGLTSAVAHLEVVLLCLSIKAFIRFCKMTKDIAPTNMRITISAAWALGDLYPRTAVTCNEIRTRAVNTNAFNSNPKAKTNTSQTVRMTDIIPNVSVEPKSDRQNNITEMATNHAALFTWNTNRPSMAFTSIIMKISQKNKKMPPDKIQAA